MKISIQKTNHLHLLMSVEQSILPSYHSRKVPLHSFKPTKRKSKSIFFFYSYSDSQWDIIADIQLLLCFYRFVFWYALLYGISQLIWYNQTEPNKTENHEPSFNIWLTKQHLFTYSYCAALNARQPVSQSASQFGYWMWVGLSCWTYSLASHSYCSRWWYETDR